MEITKNTMEEARKLLNERHDLLTKLNVLSSTELEAYVVVKECYRQRENREINHPFPRSCYKVLENMIRERIEEIEKRLEEL